MNNDIFIEVSDDFIPFFSDIVMDIHSGAYVADNCSIGYSAICSFMELNSRDSINTISLPQVGIVLMLMATDNGILNWVFGSKTDIDFYVAKLNGER